MRQQDQDSGIQEKSQAIYGPTLIEPMMFFASILLNIIMVSVFISGILFMLIMALTFPEKKFRGLEKRRTFPLSTKWAATLLLVFGISSSYIIASVVY